jgi:hypothetical protein
MSTAPGPELTINHEALLKRVLNALNEGHYDEYEALLTVDYVEEYPQSGEVICGPKNSRAIRERYPGGPLEGGVDSSSARLAATEARWLRTPAYTFVRAEGTGNVGTAAVKTRYPDGSIWWAVVLYELRSDKLARATIFFAPTFEAPDWRKPYVDSAQG